MRQHCESECQRRIAELQASECEAYASLSEEPTSRRRPKDNAGQPAAKRTGLTSRIYSMTARGGIKCFMATAALIL